MTTVVAEAVEAVEVLKVTLEAFDSIPVVVVTGMTASCLVVVAADLIVSSFKALIRMIGR